MKLINPVGNCIIDVKTEAEKEHYLELGFKEYKPAEKTASTKAEKTADNKAKK